MLRPFSQYLCALIASACIGFGQGSDPAQLLAAAKAAMASNAPAALAKLEQANAIWEKQNNKSLKYVESLELAVLAMHRKQAFLTDSRRPSTQTEVVMRALMYEDKALEICNAIPNADPALLAQALELKADTLGRIGDGAPYWDRAATVRAGIVGKLSDPGPALDQKELLSPQAGGIAPKLMAEAQPQYTSNARLRAITGAVTFSFAVDKLGAPRQVRLVKGLGYGLDEQGVAALKKWKFKPAEKDGKPFPVLVNTTVNFRLY